jgi:hypothetical protein
MQPAPQDNQLMSKHRVLSFKPQFRLEWRGQDGQSETEQSDHSASLGDSITSHSSPEVSEFAAQGTMEPPAFIPWRVRAGGAAGEWAGFSSLALDIVSLAAKPRR